MSVEDIVKETKPKMEAIIEDFKRKLSNVRTGRATIGLLDAVTVDYYGVSTPLSQMASIAVPEPQMLTEINPRELAILCQKVENLVVGAPCGIMDQMSSSCGEANQLLSMICQPAEVRGTVEIPEDLAVWGIDSGIRHSVGAGDYGSVRTGAFMGYRIIAEIAKLKVNPTEINGVVEIADEKWNGYLANISPEEFEKNYAAQLPQEISGAEFSNKYQGITDTVTRIAPEKTYQVFHPTAHPVYENSRVYKYATLLAAPMYEDNLNALGKLMYESHESYTACGLGTEGTDLLIECVKKSPKLYGARVTGGGSGGTIAVLGDKDAENQVQKIAEYYWRKTNYRPYIFAGSSLGAAAFGVLKLK